MRSRGGVLAGGRRGDPLTAHRNRDGREGAVLASSLPAIVLGALALRQAGVSESGAGGVLALGVAGVFAAFVAWRLRRCGHRWLPAVAWGGVVLFTSLGPVLLSIFPGRTVAAGELQVVGDVLSVPPDARGRVRILVYAALPERAFVAFSLAGTGPARDGTLTRGIQWWGRGEERRHFHEDRTSVLLDGKASAAGSSLALTRIAGNPATLRVRVFAPFAPAWIAWLASWLGMAAFALTHCVRRREEAAVTVAFVSVCGGLLASLVATPESVLREVIGGAMGGALVGVFLSAVARAGGRAVRRWALRWPEANSRREA